MIELPIDLVLRISELLEDIAKFEFSDKAASITQDLLVYTKEAKSEK